MTIQADKDGRLLFIQFFFPENLHNAAESILASLQEGSRVRVRVKGPLSDERSTYVGIGSPLLVPEDV